MCNVIYSLHAGGGGGEKGGAARAFFSPLDNVGAARSTAGGLPKKQKRARASRPAPSSPRKSIIRCVCRILWRPCGKKKKKGRVAGRVCRTRPPQIAVCVRRCVCVWMQAAHARLSALMCECVCVLRMCGKEGLLQQAGLASCARASCVCVLNGRRYVCVCVCGRRRHRNRARGRQAAARRVACVRAQYHSCARRCATRRPPAHTRQRRRNGCVRVCVLCVCFDYPKPKPCPPALSPSPQPCPKLMHALVSHARKRDREEMERMVVMMIQNAAWASRAHAASLSH